MSDMYNVPSFPMIIFLFIIGFLAIATVLLMLCVFSCRLVKYAYMVLVKHKVHSMHRLYEELFNDHGEQIYSQIIGTEDMVVNGKIVPKTLAQIKAGKILRDANWDRGIK